MTILGGTIVVNGDSGSACFTVDTSGTLMGNGTVGCVTLAAGSTISPGASPGSLTSSNTLWNGGGSFDWEINQANGTDGGDPGWDWLNISGTLTIAATPGNKFNLNLKTLSPGNTPGTMAAFNAAQGWTWKIATATGGIAGFNAGAFNLVTNGFANATSGGTFALTQSIATDLVLVYTPASTGGTNQYRITPTLLPGGTMKFDYAAPFNTAHALERTLSLTPPVVWIPLLTNLADESGAMTFTNPPVPGTNNFWRIRSVP